MCVCVFLWYFPNKRSDAYKIYLFPESLYKRMFYLYNNILSIFLLLSYYLVLIVRK